MKGVKSIETFMISEDNNRQHGSYHIDMSNEKSMLIYEIDEKLINELRLDGRAKFTVLADKLGISPATVTKESEPY